MNGARVPVALAVALVCAAATAPPLSGEQLLGRAKAAFRAHARPAYLSYIIERRDSAHGETDLENSYALKVWCRTADGSALVRRVWHGVAYGGLQHLTVAFDGMVDPGPPTADVFARAAFRAPVPASPSPQITALPMIGGVETTADFDYRVVRAERDGESFDLRLEPRRDPDRNRIDEVWLDARTYELRRLRVRDHLFLGLSGTSIEDEFDLRFSDELGLPTIAAIHGQTAYGAFETDYRFREVRFAEALPAWYFEPRSYGAHAADAPS